MACKEVQHDGGELSGAAALGEEDGVRRRDFQRVLMIFGVLG